MRAFYDEHRRIIDGIDDIAEQVLKGMSLKKFESQAEFIYRIGFIRGRITGMGLAEHMEDIIDGLNKSCGHAFIEYSLTDNVFEPLDRFQRLVRANSDSLTNFSSDYVGRWLMYKTLWDKLETT